MAGTGNEDPEPADVKRVAAWLDKAIKRHHIDEQARWWERQPGVEVLADPSNPAWNEFAVHVPLLHKIARWFVQRFRKDAFAGMQSRKAELDAFLAGAVAPLGRFDEYLIRKRQRGLVA